MDRRNSITARDAPLTPEQIEMIQAHLPLVEKIARSMARKTRRLELDDLASLGRQGLVDAAQTFDAQLGVSFEGFAWPRIAGAIKNGIIREAHHSQRLAAARRASYEYAQNVTDEGDPFNDTDEQAHQRFTRARDGFVAAMMLGFMTDPTNRGGEAQMAARDEYARIVQALQTAMSTMPERDRQILTMHYVEELDLIEIASRLNLGRSTVYRYHHGALERLGLRLRRMGFTQAPPSESHRK